jgi:hypothetical protein
MYFFKILKRNNMKIKLSLFVLTLLALCHFFYSCQDIIERDLSKQWVYGVAPQDRSYSAQLTQTFKWKEVKGADSYNLQIFETTDTTYLNIKEFVADTNVRATQYTYSLKPGSYKWLIYAQNSGSKSGLSIFHFTIDSTSDLGKQKVVLITPRDNRATDTLEQIFTWGAISAAKSYNFQIYPANSNIALISVKIPSGSNTYAYTFPAAGGIYNWSVSATNDASSTPPSTFKLVIDTSGVPVPKLTSPINDTTALTGNYVSLQWGSVKNATAYTFQITKNTSLPESQMDSIATIEKPLVTFYNYYHATLNTKYYWRVKALRGTREGNYSNWVSFKRH